MRMFISCSASLYRLTACSHFGNMLVLSATYQSQSSDLVDRDGLQRLLQRTIHFLLQSRYISPTLRTDTRNLTKIYEKVFGEPPGTPSCTYE